MIFVAAFYGTLLLAFFWKNWKAHGFPKKGVQLYTSRFYVPENQTLTEAGVFAPRVTGRFVNMEDKS